MTAPLWVPQRPLTEVTSGCPYRLDNETAGVIRGWARPASAASPALDDPPLSQGSVDVARARALASKADRQFGSRRDLSLDGAKATYDAGDRFGAHWIEELSAHAPGEGL